MVGRDLITHSFRVSLTFERLFPKTKRLMTSDMVAGVNGKSERETSGGQL